MSDPKQNSSSNKRRVTPIRLIELVCSGLALLLLSPLLLVIGIVVKLTSPGPAIIRMEQVGRRGQTLIRHKFRTTYLANDEERILATTQGEHVITPLGRILRATKLDELPRPLDLLLGPVSQDSPTLREQFIRDYPAVLLKMRNRHFLVLDIVALLLIPTFAMILSADGLSWWPRASRTVIAYTMVALIVQLMVFHRMGLYERYWQYAGITELNQVALAVAASAILLTALYAAVHSSLLGYDLAIYRSLPLLAGLLAFVAIGGSRFGVRGIYHWLRRRAGVTKQRRILVAGAGEAGRMAVREIRTNSVLNMEAFAFVDDDLQKVGTTIAGLPVLGTLETIPRLAEKLEVYEVIVAIPSAPLGRQHDIITLCKQNGINVSSLPGLFEILAGYKTISPIPQIDLGSLLDRQPITTDQSDIMASLQGARVLVTGAGGSIGSELCLQVARFDPAEIILLGHGENSIFEISLNLNLAFPDLTNHPVIVDVRDALGIDWAFKRYRPDIVFHAAAHKHVPFMEECAS
jgi:FlaA1/EpsC-like NDP-sugar epimerase